MHNESKETPEEEMSESPEVQADELATGTEEHGTFEESVARIIDQATPEQLKYMKSCVENALSPTPESFDVEDMPQ